MKKSYCASMIRALKFMHRMVIGLRNLKLFKLIVKTALFVVVILTFPWIQAAIQRMTTVELQSDGSDFFADLNRLGLLNVYDEIKCVFVTESNSNSITSPFLGNRIEHVELSRMSEIPDSMVDFLFVDQNVDFEIVDRVLKPNGIFAVKLSTNEPDQFVLSSNYKIVYVSQMDAATILAVRKTDQMETQTQTQTQTNSRKLLYVHDMKKSPIIDLEDADLEPPIQKQYRHKMKYLADLMKDKLADYPRRVFVDVGLAGRPGSERWFEKHYPKKNLEFEVIRIDEVGNNKDGVDGIGMNEWLEINVREEEYVVMKAEAEVVEEMMKGKAIRLVDELFLECKNQWMRGKKSKRAYWECVALYGRLKDEGVAVHQWWD